MLLLMSLTASFAQTGDTTITYTRSQLQRIAFKLVYVHECDSLLKLSDKEVSNLKFIVWDKDEEIKKLNLISVQKELIISGKDNEIKAINLQLHKTQKKLKWTKFGWASSSLAFVIGLVYLSAH